MALFFFLKGVWGLASQKLCFPGRKLKNVTHSSPRNPVEFNQSDDYFEPAEVFPFKGIVHAKMKII